MNRIVFINRYFYPDHSATSQFLTDLAFHLAKRGASVHVVTSRQVYDDPDARLPAHGHICGLHITRAWATRFGRQNLLGRTLDYLTFYLGAGWSLFALLQRGDVVVAKTDPPLISVVAALMAKMRGAKLINWIQDLFPEVAGALYAGRMQGIDGLLRSVRNWSLRTASMNVVIGDEMRKKLAGEGIKPNAMQVIHNWADGCAIQPVDREKNDLRRAWDLLNTFVVGYSGNIGRVHEFETILNAAQALSHTEGITFLFIGNGARQPWIMREVGERGLKNVVLRPYQPRDRLTLSLCVPDVHLVSLQPSMEGLIVPSKFYGIAAAGRPTIFVGNQAGEIPRILKETGSGYTVSVGDSEGLANRVLEMLRNHTETLNMGRRARLAFDQQFDQSYAFAAWEKLLQETSASPRA